MLHALCVTYSRHNQNDAYRAAKSWLRRYCKKRVFAYSARLDRPTSFAQPKFGYIHYVAAGTYISVVNYQCVRARLLFV